MLKYYDYLVNIFLWHNFIDSYLLFGIIDLSRKGKFPFKKKTLRNLTKNNMKYS